MKLSEDIIYKIYKDCLFTTCVKYININICINKTTYNLYKKINKCDIIELEKYKLCKNHDKEIIEYIKNLERNIDNYFYKLNNTNITNNIDEYIHCNNMKKYKEITEKIINNYDLEIEYYCCDGEGIKIKNKLDINIYNFNEMINNFY